MNKGTAIFLGIVIASVLAYLVLPKSFAQTEQKVFYVTLDPRLQTQNTNDGSSQEAPMSQARLLDSLRTLQEEFRVDNRAANVPDTYKLNQAGPEGFATLRRMQSPVKIVIVPNSKSPIAETVPLAITRDIFSDLEITGVKDRNNRKPRLQMSGPLIAQKLKISDVYMAPSNSLSPAVDVMSFDRNMPFRADIDGLDLGKSLSFQPQYYLTGGSDSQEPYIAGTATITVKNTSIVANATLTFGQQGGDNALLYGYDPAKYPQQIIDLGTITLDNLAIVQTKTSEQPVRIYNAVLRVGRDASQIRVGRWRARLSQIELLSDETQADKATDSFINTTGNNPEKAPPIVEIVDNVRVSSLTNQEVARLAAEPPVYGTGEQGPRQHGWVWQNSAASQQLDAENRLQDIQIRKRLLQNSIVALASISGLVLGLLIGLHFGLLGGLLMATVGAMAGLALMAF